MSTGILKKVVCKEKDTTDSLGFTGASLEKENSTIE